MNQADFDQLLQTITNLACQCEPPLAEWGAQRPREGEDLPQFMDRIFSEPKPPERDPELATKLAELSRLTGDALGFMNPDQREQLRSFFKQYAASAAFIAVHAKEIENAPSPEEALTLYERALAIIEVTQDTYDWRDLKLYRADLDSALKNWVG